MIRSAFFGLLGAGWLLACAAPATSDAGDLIPGTTGGSAGQSQGGNGNAEGGTTGTTGGSSPGESGAGGGETAGQGDGGGPQPVGGSSGAGTGGSNDAGTGGSGGSGAGGAGGSAGSVTSKEPCCVAHDGPGCNDAAIQACVCAQDPTCCSGSWNQFCVNEIKQFGCGSCEGGAGGAGGSGGSGTAGSGDAFGGSAGGGATPTFGGWCCNDQTTAPGCDIPEVKSCVCAKDPYCCDDFFGEWDSQCSAQVTEFGCAVCSGGYTCTDYPDQCVDCCISGHLSGYDSFGDDVATCACQGACKSSCTLACQGGNVSSGCAACLNQNLGSACPMTTCDGNPDCAAYLSCVDPCP